MSRKLQQRFGELLAEADRILESKHIDDRREYIDNDMFVEWKTKVKNLLAVACGEKSVHLTDFLNTEKSTWYSNLSAFKSLLSVFRAAKDDFDGGYLVSIRALVQSEVFDDQLEQARELFRAGYHVASAVIAGVVLETTLRELCDRQNPPIAHGKLDKMNADLAKAGVYNLQKQKRITSLAETRNNAAHGHANKINEDDVEIMIRDVESFLADHL